MTRHPWWTSSCPRQLDLARHGLRPDPGAAAHIGTCAVCRAATRDYVSLGAALAAAGPSSRSDADAADVDARPVDRAGPGGLTLSLRAAAAMILLLLGGWAVTLRSVDPAAWSMRGPTVALLEGAAHRSPDGALEIRWRPLEGVTRYDVRVWDQDGRLLAQRSVGPDQSTVPARLPTEADGELLWLVRAFDEHREIASSGVQSVVR